MIIDQLFEDDKKKKLNEIDPRNYDSDEDYYNDLHGDDDDEDFDGDAADDEVSDMDNDEESYYEKYVRTKNLEGYETTPFGRVSNTTPNYSQAWKVTDEGEEFLRKAYQRLKRAYEEEGQVGMINIGPALSELQQQKFGPAYVQQSGPYQMMTTDISRLIEKIEPWQKQYGQQHLARDFDPEDFSNWNKQQGMSENTSRKVDAKGLTQGEWMQLVKQKFPDAKIVQAKMIDGPAHALLSDGRKIVWNPVQGVAEGYDTAEDYRAKAQWLMRTHHLRPDEAMEYAYYDTDPATWEGSPWEDDYKQGMAEAKASTAAFRASNAKRAKLNAMSPEERKEYDKEQAEKQRKRDEARLEKDRQKLAAKKGLSESRRLNEAMLMEDPIYRKFKGVGRYIAERKMSEKEILQVFADAEAGMTDAGTGANRTFLGRGKDTAMDFAGGVKDAVNGVLNSIQNSVPVSAVDVAYDQATDALANVAGGQKGAVMQAIKKYRNLVKQYPKTAGFAKAALVAIAGLATGGAGLPAIAGLTYALDSAIKGDKLSSVLGKGAGAAALAAAGQAVSGTGADQAGTPDDFQLPADSVAANAEVQLDAAREWINADEATRAEIEQITGMSAAQLQDIAVSNDLISNADSLAPGEEIVPPGGSTTAVPGAEGFGGGTYTTMPGDQGGYIAQSMGIPFKELEGLNPQITDWNKLPVGTELQLPPTGDNVGSVWRDLSAGPAATSAAPGAETVPTAPATATTAPTAPATTAAPASPYGAVRGPMGLSYTTVANMPVIPGQPLNPTQMAVADFAVQQGNQLSPVVQAAYDLAKRGAVRESIKFKKLPFEKLVDQKITVMNWALNESIGVKSKSVHLSAVGTYTVFENVDRYRKAIMELAGVPGSTRPEFYRPDMPGGPGKQSKPGIIGKGLNWLDKAAGKVGGALSNFGHQFTTNVTKEKLKMNWHQAGKPSDSDQLAAWLVKQGVPQDVVTTVYGKMGIPYTAPATPAPAPTTPAAKPAVGGAQKQMAFYGTNPKTGKPWTYDELQAKATPTPAAVPTDDATANASAAPTTTASAKTTPAASTFPGEDPQGPNYVGRREVARRQAARDAAAAKKPAAPNFAQQGGGYASVNQPTSVKYTGMPTAKPAAPTTANLKPGGGQGMAQAQKQLTPDEYIKKIGAPALPESRIVKALKKPVAEMLSMVETKEDVAKIKKFVDQTFVKYGAVSESAFVVRNKLIEHITQVGAQRRREFARKG